ncbi:hypothetical protein KJ654_02600 [Patescibacteria group bacterium]|nr:hypothetical protein [Patescibacteria group bacterium]MBU1967108.1 hypothetical protein [Patescibacteria group bacterium]
MSIHLWHGDVLFHTDVARDFLIMDEIVLTKSPTLIGPRSGIPGVFHGPLWYYINLPFFIISKGNPITMGWFWWFLGIASALLFLYLIFKKTENLTVSLLATIGFSLSLLPSAAYPTNNYLANLLSFVIFYIFLKWYKNPKFIISALGWFILGLLVQFQMAFAVPLAMILFPIFIYRLAKTKQLKQIPSALTFLIPLSTFLLFDLRHDFLQIRSAISYITYPGNEDAGILLRVLDRIKLLFLDGVNIFGLNKYLSLLVISIFLFLGFKTKKQEVKLSIKLFIYLYVGWWITTVVFSGTVWLYYFSPFFGILFFLIAIVTNGSKKAKILLLIATIILAFTAKDSMRYYNNRFDVSSWKLLSQISAEGLSKPNRGYFLYSQDQFAYPLKYAFKFYQRQHPNSQATSYSKQAQTILVKGEDDPKNPFSTSEDWQLNKIRINKQPEKIIDYPGYTLELYDLNEEEINISIDPNLITNMHFR